MPAELTKSNVFQGLSAEHLRVVALRVEGKQWGEIAAALGVTPWTIWNWRRENPGIDQAVLEESFDCVVASRIRMAKLHPLADRAIEEGLSATKTIVAGEQAIEIPDYGLRLQASDRVKRQFEKLPQIAQEPAPPIPVGGRDDDGRGRILDAECDDFSDLERPDQHATR